MRQITMMDMHIAEFSAAMKGWNGFARIEE
jgi:hypothetical protein